MEYSFDNTQILLQKRDCIKRNPGGKDGAGLEDCATVGSASGPTVDSILGQRQIELFFKGIAWKGFRISETWESSSHDYCPTEDNTKEAWWSIMGFRFCLDPELRVLWFSDKTYQHHSPTSLWLGLRKMCQQRAPPIALVA